jgi:uncharacterized protein (TIGR02996 family)
MSDEKALLAAIWEHPHDDTPRLVYADWLQENAQPERAEFIRVQCALAQMDEGDSRRGVLEKRETQIWKKHGRKWKEGLPGNVRCNRFKRGFPTNRNVAISARSFLKMCAADFAHVPLWDYYLKKAERVWDKVLASQNLSHLLGLSTNISGCGSGGVRQLVNSPYLRNLAAVSVSSWEIGLADLDLLMNATNLPSLKELSLSYNELGDEGAIRLASSPLFARLQIVSLESTGLGHEGYAAIIRSAGAGRIESLQLAFNPLGDRAIHALTQLPGLSGVRTLYLYRTALSDAAAVALAACPALSGLESLTLGDNQIGEVGAIALAESPHLAALTDLSLYQNPLRDSRRAVAALRSRFDKRVRF